MGEVEKSDVGCVMYVFPVSVGLFFFKSFLSFPFLSFSVLGKRKQKRIFYPSLRHGSTTYVSAPCRYAGIGIRACALVELAWLNL